jgi:acylglycerol lipase
MVQPLEETFDSKGEVRIFFRSWRPAGRPKAVVAVCHGVNSHSGQYSWAADQLVTAGFAVYALDLRGRGRSLGPRFLVKDAADYVSDLSGLITIAKAREPGLPVFLLGHSAGGVVGCTYALDNQAELAGFICESFAFEVPAPKFALSVIKFLGKVAPYSRVLKLKMRDFTRDPAALQALLADPLTKNEAQPALTVAALLYATDRMRREFPRITIPLLIMHGTADKATVPKGSEFFHKTAGSQDKTLKLYQDHYHDLLNDIGKEGVMADIVAWIDKRLPKA